MNTHADKTEEKKTRAYILNVVGEVIRRVQVCSDVGNVHGLVAGVGDREEDGHR